MKKFADTKGLMTALLAVGIAAAAAPQGVAQAAERHPQKASAVAAVPQLPRFRFENFTTANGLPDNHVYTVLVDGVSYLGRHKQRPWSLRRWKDLHDDGKTGRRTAR